MKTIFSIIISLFVVFNINSSSAQCCVSNHNNHITENSEVNSTSSEKDSLSFKVSGNCGMCKMRIEKAAKSVEGVKTAVWNSDTEILEISVTHNLSIAKVHKAIAESGHDTELQKAENTVYNKLPGCCRYDR